MLTRTRKLLLVGVIVVVPVAVWIVLARNCPSAGIALTSRARYLHRLKNRTTFPQATDFDSRVTLDALLQPGDDTSRWSNDRAARVQGQVIDVGYARPEATNCYSPCRRDIHILIANRNGAAKTEQVVLEVTPNLTEWAARQGIDWSEQTLQVQLVGHWCEFEGWLYFDAGHAEESENIHPQQPGNWRATAWEIHPVTTITVIRGLAQKITKQYRGQYRNAVASGGRCAIWSCNQRAERRPDAIALRYRPDLPMNPDFLCKAVIR